MKQNRELRWYRLSKCARLNDGGQEYDFRTPFADKTIQQINEFQGMELIVCAASSADTKALIEYMRVQV